MDFLLEAVRIFLHIDTYLQSIITEYGVLTYFLLFLVVFIETGLVVMPFLPGDSLLFAAGAFAAQGSLDLFLCLLLLIAAAIIGDSVNYGIGASIGKKVFSRDMRFIKKEYLLRTERFYEAHGGKTLIIARFIPIIRTFAPFVAGVGKMYYGRFLAFNVTGGILWVSLFLLGGYFFGRIPFVEKNFELVIVGIVGVSLLPPIVEAIRRKVS